MKKTVLIFLSLFLLLTISIPIFAVQDDSTTKGDFMGLCLKDSPETINQKIQVLLQTEKINEIRGINSFIGQIIEPINKSSYNIYKFNCDTFFFKEQAYLIYIEFTRPYNTAAFDLGLKKFILWLNSFLILQNGKPDQFTYPEYTDLKDGYTYCVSEWIQKGRTIILGIAQRNDSFYANIQISDNELAEEKAQSENEEDSDDADGVI